MDERTSEALGALSALGGVLAVVAAAPSRWYGVPDTDAYVFSPTAFSPLWVERTVMPVVAALAVVLLILGAGGLVARDLSIAGRLRRWSGYVAVVGLSLIGVVLLFDAATGGSLWTGSAGAGSVLTFLVAFLVLLLGLALALPALVTLGVGYARTDRRTVGYALVAGPALSVLFSVSGWVGLPGAAKGLGIVVPFAAAFVVVGRELWTRSDPVPERGANKPQNVEGDR